MLLNHQHLAAVLFVVLAGMVAPVHAETPRKYTPLRTSEGIEYAVLGDKPAKPAPTLFVFASSIEPTINTAAYNRAGFLLAEQGFISVTLDAPAHGKDNQEAATNSLASWRTRIERGDDLIGPFAARCSKVLDHLIAEGYTDPKQVAVMGTSRGGFLATHWAAAEPRVRCVATFSPVTELLALREFTGTTDETRAKALDLQHLADKLAGRPVWVIIGNHDERVGTDRAIAFTRQLTRASIERKQPARAELHVTTTPGHSTPPAAHDAAAIWIAERMKEPRS